MVKLFFAGVAVIIFAVVASFTAMFSPLLEGITNNLGGHPSSPFHSPIPQAWTDAVAGWLGQITPGQWLIGALGLSALLLVYALGNLVRHVLRQHKERRRAWADLRWRARVAAARHQEANKPPHHNPEPEPIWE